MPRIASRRRWFKSSSLDREYSAILAFSTFSRSSSFWMAFLDFDRLSLRSRSSSWHRHNSSVRHRKVLESRHAFSLFSCDLLARIVSLRSFFFSTRWSMLPRFSCSLSYFSTAAVAASNFACILYLSKIARIKISNVRQIQLSFVESSVRAAAACALR